MTAGVETGANSSVLFERNMVNPTSLLLTRKAGESEGCSVTEQTGVATLLRRASGLTSSMVVRDEKTCRTFNERKSK